MTLIPLISAIMTAPETATAPLPEQGGPGRGYDPGAGHRPLAAMLAVGLPVALVVAVALSPMIVPDGPRSEPLVGTSIMLPVPPAPEPEPAAQTPTPRASTVDAPVRKVDTPPLTDFTLPPGPAVRDPVVADPGVGVVVPPADPPAPPRLELAQLDRKYLAGFQPDYPPREQREGVEGIVQVRVLIGTDGRVKAVELVRTDSPGFFEATKRRALSKWRFRPATRGGIAEESWKEMTVRFQIRQG